MYQDYEYLLENGQLTKSEEITFRHVLTDMADMDDVMACDSLNYMCRYLEHVYNKKVIILLDEYDTPMQEAYVYGYLEELISFLRNLFNATFKTNACLERAIMMETLLDGGSINVNIKIRELLEFQKLLFYVTKMELDVYIKVNGPFTKEYN